MPVCAQQAAAAKATPSFTLQSIAIKDHLGADILWQEDFQDMWEGQSLDESRLNQLMTDIHTRGLSEYGMVSDMKLGGGTDLQKGKIEVIMTPFTVKDVKVSGNKWFSERFITNSLGISKGKTLSKTSLDQAAAAEERLNNTTSLKLSSLISQVSPTEQDVQITVRDRFPLHASAMVADPGNNTSDQMRLNLGASYDNLFGNGQVLGYNLGTTSAFDLHDSQSHTAYYAIPFYDSGDSFMAQVAYSEANNNVVLNDLQFEGKGFQANAGYTLLLPKAWLLEQQLVFGTAYKRAENNLDLAGIPVQSTVAALLNFSLQYGGVIRDPYGITSLTVMGTGSPGNIVGEDSAANFEAVRFGANPRYATFVWGVGRSQRLPWEMSLNVSLSGQVASGPLLSTEQFSVGGAATVRGYNENQILADEGFVSRVELISPNLLRLVENQEYGDVRPFVFFDYGIGSLLDAQIGEDPSATLASTGVGMRYSFQDYASASVIFAQTLHRAFGYDVDNRILFQVNVQY